ncbi:MAG: YfiR family protein [Bacteroidetes bacterium]|nr:YfiR family protein [Bacteroidota bacterium]
MSKRIYIALLAIVLISWADKSVMLTQVKDTRSVAKALFIYNFATLIDWPEDYRKGNFVIGVLATSNDVYNELNTKYKGKSIGSQEIVVQKYASRTEIDKAHILFIGEDKSDQITSLTTQLKAKSTLIVTEKEGYLSKGAVINFVLDGSKQAYEISKPNAKKYNLVIATKLTSLAYKVVE